MSKKRTRNSRKAQLRQRRRQREDADLQIVSDNFEVIGDLVSALIAGDPGHLTCLEIIGDRGSFGAFIDPGAHEVISFAPDNVAALAALVRLADGHSNGIVRVLSFPDDGTDAIDVRTWMVSGEQWAALTGPGGEDVDADIFGNLTEDFPDDYVFVDAHPLGPFLDAYLDDDTDTTLDPGSREHRFIAALVGPAHHVSEKNFLTCSTLGDTSLRVEDGGRIIIEHPGFVEALLNIIDSGQTSSLILRSFLPEIHHTLPNGVDIPVKHVRGWLIANGQLHPTSAAEMFDNACTDHGTRELLVPERGVDYVAAYPVDVPD